MKEFDKAVKHVKTCLFWDFADGQWLDTLYTPLDTGYFNRLMQGVIDAHEAENAKLRGLMRYAHECAIHSNHATCNDCRRMNGYCILERRMRELGVEVGDGQA